jgi:hypothetical protein
MPRLNHPNEAGQSPASRHIPSPSLQRLLLRDLFWFGLWLMPCGKADGLHQFPAMNLKVGVMHNVLNILAKEETGARLAHDETHE